MGKDHILRQRILVVDTETTGMPNQPWTEVIEVGAVALSWNGIEVGAFQSLIRPKVYDERIDEALGINRISRSALRKAPSREEIIPAFLAWVQRMRCPVATAYNVFFDSYMLKRSGVELPWGPCAMRMAMATMRGHGVKKGFKLFEAAAFYKVLRGEQTHRALDDARMAAAVLVANEKVCRGERFPSVPT